MEKDCYREVGLTIYISAKTNYLLSNAAARSKRTKTMEVLLRIEDHLNNFPDIATEGLRFREGGTKG
ncbi:TraY domain-containing protein [Yersinia mollaretii]|uniref:TraY domain-containing protein n=1 Tax=Yersinia mollaretii TaxID=33060 RepID=UPI0011A643FA|nr:TraY domain-containing protein [Yersinia mollaretii]